MKNKQEGSENTKDVRVVVRVPSDCKKALELAAEAQDSSVGRIIRLAIRKFLEGQDHERQRSFPTANASPLAEAA